MLRALLGAHKLALVERSLTLCTAIGYQSRIAHIGSGVAGRKDEYVESILEVLNAQGVKEAPYCVLRSAVTGTRREGGITRNRDDSDN